MLSLSTTPEPTSRRGSLRSATKDKKPINEAQRTVEDDEKDISKKSVASSKKGTKSKKNEGKTPPKKTGTKLKSSDEEDETDSEKTLIEDESDSPLKKTKTSPKNDQKEARGRKLIKRKEITGQEQDKTAPTESSPPLADHVLVDPAVLSDHITLAVQAAVLPNALNSAAVTSRIAQGIHAAVRPYLEVLDPFMQFQMLCSKLTADTEVGMAAEEKRLAVVDLVGKLKEGYGKEEEWDGEDGEELFDDGLVKSA